MDDEIIGSLIAAGVVIALIIGAVLAGEFKGRNDATDDMQNQAIERGFATWELPENPQEDDPVFVWKEGEDDE